MADSQGRSRGDTDYDPSTDQDNHDFPPTNGTGNSTQPVSNTLPASPFDPSRIQQQQGETRDQTVARYQKDYWAPDREQVLSGINSWQPTSSTSPSSSPNYSDPAGQLSAVSGWLQAGGFGGDDPNYWVKRINETGGFTPGNLDYWQKRIAAGQAGEGPGGAYYESQGGSSNQNPLPSDATNNLFNTLLERSGQSLNVNPNDPIIKGQTNAYNASQTQSMRKYLADLAEKGGTYGGNQSAETRSAYETAGQNGSQFQASLLSNELTQRRQEIQDALTQEGSMLSDQQHLALQQKLAELDNALKQQQINSGNDQFAQTFGLNASDLAWKHDAISRGLIKG